jgi:hypothetical protein
VRNQELPSWSVGGAKPLYFCRLFKQQPRGSKVFSLQRPWMDSRSGPPPISGTNPRLRSPVQQRPQIPPVRELEHGPSPLSSSLHAPNLTTYVHHVRKSLHLWAQVQGCPNVCYSLSGQTKSFLEKQHELTLACLLMVYAYAIDGAYTAVCLAALALVRVCISLCVLRRRSLHFPWKLHNLPGIGYSTSLRGAG